MPARLYRAKPLGLGARIRWIVSGLGCLALIGCDALPTPPSTTPQPRPAGLTSPVPVAPTPPPEPSALSNEQAFFYMRIQQQALAQDLMRVDGGGIDTPYTSATVARNFERIVFYEEYVRNRGLEVSDGSQFGLQKWDKPVNFSLEFGASIPAEARARDTQIVRRYAQRLARISKHPIALNPAQANFHILTMGQDDRPQLLRRIAELDPSLKLTSIAQILDAWKVVSCVVVTTSDDGGYTPDLAVAIIRTELPALARQACYHEELAQGLGLANDSPQARPSIFNDDDEFALLTTHDEELLRLLYNPALTPGMSVEEARPIVNQILLGRAGPG